MADRILKIHPAIGVARVGNADRSTGDGFFVGPETPGMPANWDPAAQQFRPFKLDGRIKAQAARFRIWEYVDVAGKMTPSRELSLDDQEVTSIKWTVHLANRKASFFEFAGRRGEADTFASLGPDDRRNGDVKVNRAHLLDIDEGAKSIQGKSAPKVEFKNSKAHIPIKTLGELRTDAQGRLLVLGGMGESNSTKNPPEKETINHYANNDTWFDDVSDGPVTATVTLRGPGGTLATFEAAGAWVMVGPPDFAPSVGNVVTMYDTLWDLAVRGMSVPADNALFDEYAPGRGLKSLRDMNTEWAATNALSEYIPSFTREIFPMFQRAFFTRWVHKPLVSQPGIPQHHNRIAEARAQDLAKLPGNVTERKSIFNRLRNPDNPNQSVQSMPKAFGDDYDGPRPTAYLALSRVQHALLRQWMLGTFESDWAGVPPRPTVEDITPEGLDKAALENCVGGAFFPGIEASWLVRKPQIYAEPFRVRHGATVGALTVGPGFFSQQMALPWQADFWACAKEPLRGDPTTFHAWWPAQRPDEVFREGEAEMVEWARTVSSFNAMVKDWSTRGFVLEDGEVLVEKEGPD